MITLLKQNCALKQQGQAATEFIIASVFILVPLFLIIPLLGKYIDIRQAAINKARFEAWEYTVWQVPDKDPRVKIKSSQSAGERSYAVTRNRAKHYFFSDPTSDTYFNPTTTYHPNPLWTDHKRDSLFTSAQASTGKITVDKTPTTFSDGSLDVIDYFKKAIGMVTDEMGTILHWEGVDGKFDILDPKYEKQYYVSSNVITKIRSLDDILPQFSLNGIQTAPESSPLTIYAKASVLTDAWNSGSANDKQEKSNATVETNGLVLTAFVRPLSDEVNKAIGTLNNLLGKIPIINAQLPSMPDFGYVDSDAIPLEFLDVPGKSPREIRGASELKGNNQLYYYEE